MTPEAPGHRPVLVAEVLRELAPAPGETLIDCTAGLGGHAARIAERLGPAGRVILIDLDPANLARATERIRALPEAPAVTAVHSSFVLVEAIAARESVRADLLLADLGFSSNQVDDPGRGLSFTADGPLDMRLDPSCVGTAADLVNGLPERRLADLIFEFGEEPMARRIARRVVEARASAPIATTAQLAQLVREAYGARAAASRMHPATRTFMALRIAVNDELGALERLLEAVERGAAAVAAGRPGWLGSGARLGIIAFHSLEDRRVKHRFRAITESVPEGLAEASKKPIEASESERNENPRARSAKLRILRLGGRC